MFNETKTESLKKALMTNDRNLALKLGKNFHIGLTPDEVSAIKRGYECLKHPSFYNSIGYHPEECMEQAMNILRSLVCTL